jgi:hypothetical protein
MLVLREEGDARQNKSQRERKKERSVTIEQKVKSE